MKSYTVAGISGLAIVACAGLARAQAFSEGFEGGAIPANWFAQNNSTPPLGAQSWQVNATGTIAGGAANLAPAHGGTMAAYVNYASTAGATGTETISNWLMTPQATTITNGDVISFWTRTRNPATYPDRVQVRLSTAAASTNVGTAPTDVGDFTTLLLDINPTYLTTGYPVTYTQESVTISGLGSPANGRFAFRYFVENGGPAGVNSEMIGIDDVAFAPATATGACCKNDGTCTPNLTLATCTQQSGNWSVGLTCAQAACPQPGACCVNTGTGCVANQLPAACLALGGVYQGAAVTCATANCSVPCPAITGAFTGLGTGTSSDPNAVFGTQTNRLFRDGVPDTCALAATGGAPLAGTFTYVKHSFVNNSPLQQCVTFAATIDCTAAGNPLYAGAYVGAFDPANISTNNVASTGNSAVAGAIGMTFIVPASTAFSVVISEVGAGLGCANYSFNMNGGGSLSCNTSSCYANCDNSTQAPVANIADFTCFLTKYAAGNPHVQSQYSNCDNSTTDPYLNIADFTCFLTKYAAGCP